jgi:hypothetical protein
MWLPGELRDVQARLDRTGCVTDCGRCWREMAEAAEVRPAASLSSRRDYGIDGTSTQVSGLDPRSVRPPE